MSAAPPDSPKVLKRLSLESSDQEVPVSAVSMRSIRAVDSSMSVQGDSVLANTLERLTQVMSVMRTDLESKELRILELENEVTKLSASPRNLENKEVQTNFCFAAEPQEHNETILGAISNTFINWYRQSSCCSATHSNEDFITIANNPLESDSHLWRRGRAMDQNPS